MEDEKSHLTQLATHAEEYLKTRQELTQLVITEKIVMMGSSMTSSLIIVMLFIVVFFFASIGLALFISSYFDENYLGFAIVAGFFLILALVLLMMRDRWLKRPMMNIIIKNIFKEEENGQN